MTSRLLASSFAFTLALAGALVTTTTQKTIPTAHAAAAATASTDVPVNCILHPQLCDSGL